MLLLLAANAFADARPHTAAVGAEVVGEAVHDPSTSLVYNDTSVSGEVEATATFARGLEGELSVGYRRMGGTELDATGAASGTSTWIWYAPLAFTLGPTLQVGQLTLSAGAGPAIVMWSEQAKTADGIGFSGGKYGVLIDGGVRAPMPGFAPSLHDPDKGPRGVDLVATVGYRLTLRSHATCADGVGPCGLDFSALRLGLGARARF